MWQLGHVVILLFGVSLAEDSECFDGFHLMSGDIPGMGQIDRYKNGQTDNVGCGRLCESNEECCSYEFSPTDKLCNLNKDCKPNAEKHKDYIFCSKNDEAG